MASTEAAIDSDSSTAASRKRRKADRTTSPRKKIQNQLYKKRSRTVTSLLQNTPFTSTSSQTDLDRLQSSSYNLAGEHSALIRELEGQASEPITSNVAKARLRDFREKGISEGMHILSQSPPPYDVQLVDSVDHLAALLREPFRFIYGSACQGMATTHNWTIEKQVRSMAATKCTGNAYRPAAAPTAEGSLTHGDISMEVVERIFLHPKAPHAEDLGTNVLDIEHRHSFSMRLPLLDEFDLVHQINLMEAPLTFGRQGAPSPRAPEWFILSDGPTVSPFHADNAGHCTFVCGIEGSKQWFIPVGHANINHWRFATKGPNSCVFPYGFTSVSLGPGDWLIQPPGQVHAVITSNLGFVAGSFIYVAACFHLSIRQIARELADHTHVNDDTKPYEWRQLTRILRYIDHTRLFNTHERELVHYEVKELLLRQQIIHFSAQNGLIVLRRPEREDEFLRRISQSRAKSKDKKKGKGKATAGRKTKRNSGTKGGSKSRGRARYSIVDDDDDDDDDDESDELEVEDQTAIGEGEEGAASLSGFLREALDFVLRQDQLGQSDVDSDDLDTSRG